MEDIVLGINEQFVLLPGEALMPGGGEPLRLRFESGIAGGGAGGQPGLNYEQMLWNTLKGSLGNQTALYRRGTETFTVYAVPETPKPDGFAINGSYDWKLYKNVRVFKIGKAELSGLLPKEGDILEFGGAVFAVKKTTSGPCYEDIGNYNVMMRIFTSVYRPKGEPAWTSNS